jgi:hypothetical protein
VPEELKIDSAVGIFCFSVQKVGLSADQRCVHSLEGGRWKSIFVCLLCSSALCSEGELSLLRGHDVLGFPEGSGTHFVQIGAKKQQTEQH